MDYEQASACLDEWLDVADSIRKAHASHQMSDAEAWGAEAELMLRAPVIHRIIGALGQHQAWRQGDLAQLYGAARQAQYLLHDRMRIDGIFSEPGPRLAGAELHPIVWDAARSFWRSNARQAVAAAARAVNAQAQDRLGRRDVSDRALMLQAFSLDDPEPGRPRLRLWPADGSETFRSVHAGAVQFGSGCFMALRNPAALPRRAPGALGSPCRSDCTGPATARSLTARWAMQFRPFMAAVRTADLDIGSPGASLDGPGAAAQKGRP
jgi:hypothetical protein